MDNTKLNSTDSIMGIERANTNLLDYIIEDKDDLEDDESEDIIIKRVITSKISNPSEELKISPSNDIAYTLIRFDAYFSSEKNKYNWIIYHTPKEIRKNIKKLLEKIMNKEILTNIPINPIIIQIRNDDDVISNIYIVTEFYNNCFNDTNFQKEEILNNFFNIGGTSFLKNNAGNKPFEGWVQKKVDRHCCRKCFSIFCYCFELFLFSRYNKRWVVLNEDHLFYLNDSMGREGKVVYFLDKDMKLENDGKNGLKIKNASMYLNLQFNNFFDRELWKYKLEKRRNNIKLLVDSNRYNAYTNGKNFNICKYFCDGASYFEDLFYHLMDAKNSIYITDWWMSPELFLLRPVDEKIYLNMKEQGLITTNLGNKISRLMDILNLKAKQGVKIYILIYYEVGVALTLNSKHTKTILTGLNNNIKVTRHPPEGLSTLLWSHHEKLVVIDQMIGYVGGLDLCWGRYDTPEHPIYEPPNEKREYYFPLIDYSNARICDFENVDKYTIESVKRINTVRLPWHDVHSKIIGPAVSDIARHFIERWNYANFSARKKKGLTSINQSASFSQNKFNFWQMVSEQLKKGKLENKTKKVPENKDNPLQKSDTNETINIKENKIIENNLMKNKEKIDDNHILIKKDENKLKNIYYNRFVNRLSQIGNKAMEIDLEDQIANDELYKKYFNKETISSKVQVLRSASEWSAGLKKTEHSILNAYYQLISNAEHYIYIENQFFITKSWTEQERKECHYSISDIVNNEIGLYIRRRIEKAYYNKENFKVYIFLPLIPGFAGEPEESATIQFICKHTYAGICNNYDLGLVEQLQKIMGNKWKNYLGFYSLRNHCLVNGIPKTEIIYIHSKLIIVDDTKVLIGSANINDRSLLGNRDSEFAVLIKEKRLSINNKCNRNFLMNGKKYLGSNFATNFRKDLMAEHLGLSSNDPILDDPVSDELSNLIISRAKINTQAYRYIFSCYPDDTFTNFNILKNSKLKLKNESHKVLLNRYNSEKNKIIWHIVEFPLDFLKEEILGMSIFSAENLLPEYNFT